MVGCVMTLLRRRIVFILVLLLIILMGCQTNSANEDSKRELLEVESDYDHATNEFIDNQTSVALYVDEGSYSLPFCQLKVILDNKGEVSVGYDHPVYLDKFQDGIWVQVPYNDELEFSMEAFELEPGETFEQEINQENLDYKLTNGEYRIRKSIQIGTENIVIADRFKINN